MSAEIKLEAVSLDAGGTLFQPWPSVGEVYADVASRHGVKVRDAAGNESGSANAGIKLDK